MKDNGVTVSCTINDVETVQISPRMKALISIAGKVQKSGRSVSENDILHARENGASDNDIHDTVFISASFCFFNRYVDGLHTLPMRTEKDYIEPARALLKFGYKYPNFIAQYFMKRTFAKSQRRN